MNLITSTAFASYWSTPVIAANLLIGCNLVGALLLGMLVGYERSYNGRAAGMRTYGLVCMASAALTVLVGYPQFWYGGMGTAFTPDPTRVVQGVVSGIGFLCAGVIIKDGMSISGLTTAASIWAASAIGVMVGVGFYGAAIILALLCMVSMSWLRSFEIQLPSRPTLAVTMKFDQSSDIEEGALAKAAQARGYELILGSLSISVEGTNFIWKFVVVGLPGVPRTSLAKLAQELVLRENLVSFSLEPSRN
jgi:putative Mg2+ transporter-C (MgtC) family protein